MPTLASIQKKDDKLPEVRKSLMSNMRQLAALFLEVKKEEPNTNFGDLFNRTRLMDILSAVDRLCQKNNGLKAGLKMVYANLIPKAAKHHRFLLRIKKMDEEANEVSTFLDMFELARKQRFSDALYMVLKRRQETLRKPHELPLEEDIYRLRVYCLDKLQHLSKDFDCANFVALRNVVVARLTIFNARRGGEPSRLLLSEWNDAKEDSWIDQQRRLPTDEIEAQLLKTCKVGYQTGKGSGKLVPIIFPEDCLRSMNLLTSIYIRDKVGILSENPYAFPATNQSRDHASGWHALRAICCDAGIDSGRITATKQRHRVSTLFASLELTRDQREQALRHMGHSEDISKNVYTDPLALQELRVVGRHLKDFDENQGRETSESMSTTVSTMQKPANKASDSDHTEFILPTSSTPKPSVKPAQIRAKGVSRMRWTEEENEIFKIETSAYLSTSTKRMPPRNILEDLALKLSGRTFAQVRVKALNIVTGKLRF